MDEPATTGRDFLEQIGNWFESVGDWFARVFEWHRLFFDGEIPLLDLPVGITLLLFVYLMVAAVVPVAVIIGVVQFLSSSGPR